jgi:hypothetical protein
VYKARAGSVIGLARPGSVVGKPCLNAICVETAVWRRRDGRPSLTGFSERFTVYPAAVRRRLSLADRPGSCVESEVSRL